MRVHFPAPASAHKTGHRLSCHITRTWRTRPLMSIDDAVAGIAATVTSQGLKCAAVTDDVRYPGGVKVSDTRMQYLQDRVIDRGEFHGERNYAILPAACRIRLGMTWTLLGQILGVWNTAIRAIPILEEHGITAGPGAPRITTLDALREHAAARGIPVTGITTANPDNPHQDDTSEAAK